MLGHEDQLPNRCGCHSLAHWTRARWFLSASLSACHPGQTFLSVYSRVQIHKPNKINTKKGAGVPSQHGGPLTRSAGKSTRKENPARPIIAGGTHVGSRFTIPPRPVRILIGSGLMCRSKRHCTGTFMHDKAVTKRYLNWDDDPQSNQNIRPRVGQGTASLMQLLSSM